MAYFVYFLLLGELVFTWDITYDYVHVLFVIYSVRKVLFDDFFCRHTSLCWLKYQPYYRVCTLLNFTSYFVYLLLLGEHIIRWMIFYGLHVHIVSYSMATYTRTSGDLFCIHTFSWWPILYIRIFLMSYLTYSSRSFFTVVTFMASFVHLLLLLGEFMFTSVIFYGYMCMRLSLHFMATCTHLWWPILYTYLVLVIYSVYKEVCDCIIFEHTTSVFFLL